MTLRHFKLIINDKEEKAVGKMNQLCYRPAWIEIDLTAVKSNIQHIQAQLGPAVDVIAVVKANGYGHGDVEVARAAIESGARGLAVALLEEAVKLRQAGIKVPILVLGWVAPEFISVAIEHQITLTVFQASWLETYYKEASQSKNYRFILN